MKHINITNWQGNITDWTKFNYIYGGLDDTLADRVNLSIPGTNLRNYLRKSNNLVHFNNMEGTTQGFSYSYKDGVITISGTARSSGNIFFPILENVVTVTTGVHRLTLFIDNPNSSIKLFVGHYQGAFEEEPTFKGVDCNSAKVLQRKDFTVGGTMNMMPYINATQGTEYNITIKPMVTVGEEIPTTYEPYGTMVLVENVDSNLQPLNPPKVTIFNQVDLGTLNWIYAQELLFQASISDIKSFNPGVMGNISCPKYTTMVWNQLADKGIATAIGYVRIKDSLYTNATTFKEAMNGVILIYEAKDSSSASTLSMASPMQLDKTNVEEDIEYLEDTKFNEEILSEEE